MLITDSPPILHLSISTPLPSSQPYGAMPCSTLHVHALRLWLLTSHRMYVYVYMCMYACMEGGMGILILHTYIHTYTYMQYVDYLNEATHTRLPRYG